jgi:hypothetical protein
MNDNIDDHADADSSIDLCSVNLLADTPPEVAQQRARRSRQCIRVIRGDVFAATLFLVNSVIGKTDIVDMKLKPGHS